METPAFYAKVTMGFPIKNYKLTSAKFKKKVLMGCTQPYWSVLQVGSQHIARQFAKNNWEVHYCSSPISILHIARPFDRELRKRFLSAINSPTIHHQGKIFSYIPFSGIAPAGYPFLRSKNVSNLWYKTIFLKFLKEIKINGVDLIYIDNLSYHFLVDCVPHRKSIFRVMDIHDGFPGWGGQAKAVAKKIAQKTDLTVYSALGLKNYVETLDPINFAMVPNGVDYNLFKSKSEPSGRPKLLKDVPDPIVIYSGIVDSRIDFPIIIDIAKALPFVSFVFVGPCQYSLQMELPSNVFMTGPIPHQKLPDILHSAKIGFIPFDVKNRMNIIQGIRPLKLLEYLAAGLPVVSAYWPEIEAMNAPVFTYRNRDECIHFIEKIIRNKYDTIAEINYAKKRDWSHVFSLMMSLL